MGARGPLQLGDGQGAQDAPEAGQVRRDGDVCGAHRASPLQDSEP